MSLENDSQKRMEEQLISDLDVLQIDPYIGDVMKDVRIWNELLSCEPKSEEEINELMNEVDSQWSALINLPVRFTGRASFLNVSSAEGGVSNDYYEDEMMVFKGIIPHQINEYDEGELRLYDLRLFFSRQAIDYEGDRVELTGSAQVEEVAQVDCDNYMSVERAIKILEHYQPDLLSDIEAVLLNPSEDEAETIMGLANCVFDIAGLDGATIDVIKSALGVLCRSYAPTDHENSYVTTILGDGWVEREGGEYLRCEIQMSGLTKVDEVVWGLSPSDGDDTVVPHIALQILGKEVGAISDDKYYVPITSFKEFASLRMAFYLSK